MFHGISKNVVYCSMLLVTFVSSKQAEGKSFDSKIISRSLRRTHRRLDDYYFNETTFDLSKFSLKYHSCASLSFFSIESGEDNEYNIDDTAVDDANEQMDDYYGYQGMRSQQYPYSTPQVINFHLCPADSCQDDSWSGCQTVYGNYLITLEDYIEAQKEYNNEYMEQYCDYCYQCIYFYQNFGAYCNYYDSCADYQSSCEGGNVNNENGGEQDEEIDYTDYVQCTEVDVLEDAEYYHYCSYCKKCEYFANNFNGECDNYEICQNYKSSCYENRRLDEEDNNNAEEGGDDLYEGDKVNDLVYLKMYCDGSLKIGMFSDDQCYDYIGDKFSIYNTTGLVVDEEDYYDVESQIIKKDCISCSPKVRVKQFWY